MGGGWAHGAIGAWEALGTRLTVGGHGIFVVDLPPGAPPGPSGLGVDAPEPLVVVHGYPTSSFDYAEVAPALAEHRRVVLVDLLGFGLSDKPDQRYTMAGQADVVAGVLDLLGITRCALLTHDMGDTVGGELLARSLEGSWPVEVTRRVVTNGSIYIDQAHLTDGQLFLLGLPDEMLPEGSGPGVDGLAAALAATLAPTHRGLDMRAHAELVAHDGGGRLLARQIRYIEERRAHERRFTGAIESHPAPLHVVWGPEDPIAVAAMAETLQRARPDASLAWVTGAGHYPQVEDPERWTAAVLDALA
jgi:pimeloyl-ACP methyl ester carboxylesterase